MRFSEKILRETSKLDSPERRAAIIHSLRHGLSRNQAQTIMAIRIRQVDGETVALCAAKTLPEVNDIYLDDNAHHALYVKFGMDFESEGRFEYTHVDKIIRDLMLQTEVEDNG
jgi:hypothetical protein